MKSKAFEAHFSCGYFASNDIKIGSVVNSVYSEGLGQGGNPGGGNFSPLRGDLEKR